MTRVVSMQEVCFHAIVAMTHDSTLLLSALRQLPGSQALALAQYLLKLMTKYSGWCPHTCPKFDAHLTHKHTAMSTNSLSWPSFDRC